MIYLYSILSNVAKNFMNFKKSKKILVSKKIEFIYLPGFNYYIVIAIIFFK